MKRAIPFAAVFLALFTLGAYGDAPPTSDASKQGYRILFVGDTSFGENYQDKIAARGGVSILQAKGYDYGLKQIAPLLRSAQKVVANLETPLTDLRQSPLASFKRYTHYSSTHKSPETFRKFNFTLFSLANNHTLDFGLEGLRQTLDALDRFGLGWLGAGMTAEEASRPYRLDIESDGPYRRWGGTGRP